MKLTKNRKRAEAKKQMRKIIKDNILPHLLEKIDSALQSGSIPEEWYEEDNHLLTKAVIDNFCAMREYRPLSEAYRKDFENLSKFL